MSTEKQTQAFKGKPLQLFTPQRQSVALAMGMKYGYVSEEDHVRVKVTVPVTGKRKKGEPKTRTVEIVVYKQIFKDSMIYIWLCLQPTSRVLRAERLPDEAVLEMWKWAEKEGVNVGTPYAELCNNLFLTAMGEIHAAQTHPVPKHPSDEPEDDDDSD